jgi:hypothetical protein
MSSPNEKIEIVKKEFPSNILKFGIVSLVLGIILLLLGFFVDHTRAAFSNLVILMVVISVGLGSLFFIGIEYLSGAVWSTVFRRVPEFLGAVLLIVPILAIPVYLNSHGLYHWTHEEALKSDEILKGKSGYLNMSFFTIRLIFYFVVWIGFYLFLSKNSSMQDKINDPNYTKLNIRASALMMPFYAITITFAVIDLVMSLEPHWFSTIIGVYYFAGSLLAGLAVATFFIVYFNENGYFIKGIVSDHYYSLGAFLFAFTNFWAYIAFSQFLLIWYANLPEETFWYLNRWEGSWIYFSIGLVLIRFVVPYFYLLSQPSKTNPKKLLFISVWIFAAHIIDLFWLSMPTYSKGGVNLGWIELSIPLFTIGMIILVFYLKYKNNNLVPIGDPKLKRSIDFRL